MNNFYRVTLLALVSFSGTTIADDLPKSSDTMPFFESNTEARQRTKDYKNAITDLKEQIKNCKKEDVCQQLKEQKSDYEYAERKHIEANGLPIFSILGGPGYVPETGVMLAAGALYSFSTNRTDRELQRSSITMVAIANQMEDGVGFGIRSKQNMFFYQDTIRYKGSLVFGQQSQYYWGIGYDAGKAQDASDDISMDYMFADYKGDLTFQSAYGLNIGPALHLLYFDPDKDSLPDTALNDPNFQEFEDQTFTLGLGFTVQYDSRDVTVNAKKGEFFNLEYLKYGTAIGGDSDYQKLLVDYRYYYPLRKNDTLAFYNAVQWSQGDVPYYDMPTLGGASSMRGIYTGHYRDKTAVENTVELRHTFLRANGQPSVHGMVVWGGVGYVAPTLSNFYDNFLYSYGVGYRYELQPRMNVRVDLGFGPSESGFYLTFTEAF
ncbi:BamA/TamA family outer membrane protein [Vibrio sp. SS-MA-C1-2]|uniref:BamA/TamA family outer membrane protein n=1 Tax=Vibrio sp. SS-MA-C1-2 TaxID=2908646 RepID=UPI001F376C67|nr:BamA/TamA family outer membrane protein [Vibrio sp. SS-MA-C1-2]UJF17590.1 BamA/TamA family outer membrane protein [Vibrio sp. SS-MA-C1-2]